MRNKLVEEYKQCCLNVTCSQTEYMTTDRVNLYNDGNLIRKVGEAFIIWNQMDFLNICDEMTFFIDK